MSALLSIMFQIPLVVFMGLLAGAALVGGISALSAGIPGVAISFFVMPLAGFAFHRLKMMMDAKRKPAPTVAVEESAEREIPADRLDPLTGLANMNGLNAWFAEKTARLAQDNKAIIVLAADLADFDQMIKSRGEEKANAVIKEVARRVLPFAGEDGIAARIEGDEFAAIATVVPNHSHELAAEMAGKLTEMIQRPVELPDGVIWIGGSVGAATGNPLEGLAVFERAKKALKKAKQLGRGHYFVDVLAPPKE